LVTVGKKKKHLKTLKGKAKEAEKKFSKAVQVTNETQKDLAPGTLSGLDVAQRVLHKIDGISFCTLSSRDVVRHPLVQKIVKAYENYEIQSQSRRGRKEERKRR